MAEGKGICGMGCVHRGIDTSWFLHVPGVVTTTSLHPVHMGEQRGKVEFLLMAGVVNKAWTQDRPRGGNLRPEASSFSTT